MRRVLQAYARSVFALVLLQFTAQRMLAQIIIRSEPSAPVRGALVRLVATAAGLDLPANISGSAAGEPLHFIRRDSITWTALAGVPIEGGDSLTVELRISRHGAHSVDSTEAWIRVLPSRAASERLRVPPSKITLTKALQQRVDREIEQAHAIGRRAHATPPLWTEPFSRPRASRITSDFGTSRVYNGAVASRHLGTDFAGKVGDSVFAANRGVVAAIGHFYLAGNVIYLDHGAGLTTAYFHLSRTFVSEGDTVSKGQPIGAVGKTGRVTGPHLHWSVRYGIVPVDPMSLVEIGGRW